MTMITPSYLGETIEYSSLHACRSTLEDPTAGILVHAYLMYGFPTQTAQDTVDALEYVRQLFAAGCIHSAFFHRFTCTVHSPVGKHPEQYGVTLSPPLRTTFANNDVNFTDATGIDHDVFGAALKKALYNYMLGIGLDIDVREWFQQHQSVRGIRKSARRRASDAVPRTIVPPNLIERALA